MNDNELPHDWDARDSLAAYNEYIALIRAAWQAGDLAELPPLFRPTPRPQE